jgi:hypothetical protein
LFSQGQLVVDPVACEVLALAAWVLVACAEAAAGKPAPARHAAAADAASVARMRRSIVSLP